MLARDSGVEAVRFWLLVRLLPYLKAASGANRKPPRPQSRLHEAWWRERLAAKRAEVQARRDQIRLVFLGDSITQNWELDGPAPWARFASVWRAYYSGRGALNLGYSGDTTQNLLWRVRDGELDGLAPRVATLLIGINDMLLEGRDGPIVAESVINIVEELRFRLPETHLVLLSILPSAICGWIGRETARANALLRAREWGTSFVHHLDVGSALMTRGRPDLGFFCDRQAAVPVPILLHPSAEGQARLAAAVEPLLASLLGEPG